jgi:signal transduction histidine kinase
MELNAAGADPGQFGGTSHATSAPGSVLFVEDNRADQFLWAKILARVTAPGAALVWARTLAEALDHLNQATFDLVLLDLGLPDSWGLQTFLRVKDAAPMLPIIVLTASDDEALAVLALRAGAQDFLVKGRVDADLLRRAIRYAVERNQAEKELRQSRAQVQQLNAELERRVAERTGELSASNQALESFCYSVSHELRSPLRAIDGFSRSVLDEYASVLQESAREDLARVRTAAQRMGTLIDGLLEVARVNRNPMNRQKVDLTSMALAAAADLRAKEPGRDVELVIADGLGADADPALLRVLLDNLLSNAWCYTGKRAAGRIELGTSRQRRQRVYFVRDNGAGFDMAHVEKLFQPFQRLHAPMDFPGVGVGLAVVKRIVERHGGSVWAEAAADKGATFYFTLGAGD